MIYGFDLSATRTAYAALDMSGRLITYGSWRFPKKGHPGSRWSRFRRLLEGVHDIEPMSVIAYEQVMPRVQTGPGKRNAPVGQVYGSLLGVVETFAFDYEQIPLVPIHLSTAKKTAGHGRFTKEEMVRAAQNQWNITIVNHDEADAMWVAETARMKALYDPKDEG